MKTKIKNNKNKIISLVLIFALIITGVFAFLTATDSKVNLFTIGTAGVALLENFDMNDNDVLTDGTNETPDEMELRGGDLSMSVPSYPNDNVLKEPWLVNTGSIEEYVYMEVGIQKVKDSALEIRNADGTEIVKQAGDPDYTYLIDPADLNVGNDPDQWTLLAVKVNDFAQGEDYAMDYFLYFYNSSLMPNEETEPLFTNVDVANYCIETGAATAGSDTFAISSDPSDVASWVDHDLDLLGTFSGEGGAFGFNDDLSGEYLSLNTMAGQTVVADDILSFTMGGNEYTGADLHYFDMDGVLLWYVGDPFGIDEDDGTNDGTGGIAFISYGTSGFTIPYYTESGARVAPYGRDPSETFDFFTPVTSVTLATAGAAQSYSPISIEMPINGYAIQQRGFASNPVAAWKGVEASVINKSRTSNYTYGANDVQLQNYASADYQTVSITFADSESAQSGGGGATPQVASGWRVIKTVTIPAGSTLGSAVTTSQYTRDGYTAAWTTTPADTSTQINENTVFNSDTVIYLNYNISLDASAYADPSYFIFYPSMNSRHELFLVCQCRRNYGCTQIPTSGTKQLPAYAYVTIKYDANYTHETNDVAAVDADLENTIYATGTSYKAIVGRYFSPEHGGANNTAYLYTDSQTQTLVANGTVSPLNDPCIDVRGQGPITGNKPFFRGGADGVSRINVPNDLKVLDPATNEWATIKNDQQHGIYPKECLVPIYYYDSTADACYSGGTVSFSNGTITPSYTNPVTP